MGWSFLDHTGDLAVSVEHESLTGLFEEALKAMCDSVTPVAGVAADVARRIELEAEALDLLLVDWLEEALYLFETEALVLAASDVELVETELGWSLSARAFGEIFDPERHPLKVPIKAVTYHGLTLECTRGSWRATVVFDI